MSSSWDMVVNPFQSIPGYIGSGIPLNEGFFWKFWITRTEVIKENCYQSIILVTWKTEMPRNTYSWQKDIEDKIVLITDRYWGSRNWTQNRGVERRWLSVLGRTLPPGEETKKVEGTATPWQRVGSSELFSSSGERCEPAKSAETGATAPQAFRVSLSGAPHLSPQRLPLDIPVIIAIIKKKRKW